MDAAHVAMKSGGYYDQHSDLQWAFALKAQPILADALGQIPLQYENQPFVVVDYGCADGANSVRLTDFIVSNIHQRRPAQAVAVFYNDLFTNNFNQLFQNLGALNKRRDAQFRYHKGAPIGPVFEFATGGSFYDPVMPPISTNLGFSMTAVHWLSERPNVEIHDQVASEGADMDVKKAYAYRAELDWLAFLGNRAEEMASGGKLLVGVLAQPEAPARVHAPLALINDVAKRMVEEGVIDRDDYIHTAAPIYRRTESEVLAPLTGKDAAFRGNFRVDQCTLATFECPFRAQLLKTGDIEAYASGYVGFVRAISESAIVRQLYRTHFEAGRIEEGRAACSAFYERMLHWLIDHPHDYVEDIGTYYLLLTAL